MVAAGAGSMWLALRGRHAWAARRLRRRRPVRARRRRSAGSASPPCSCAMARAGARARRCSIPVAVGAPVAALQLDPLPRPARVVHARRLWGWHGQAQHLSRHALLARGAHARSSIRSSAHPGRRRGRAPVRAPLAAARGHRRADVRALLRHRRATASGAIRRACGRRSCRSASGSHAARRCRCRSSSVLVLFQGFFLHLYAHAYELQ